jgi:hypothetical protein
MIKSTDFQILKKGKRVDKEIYKIDFKESGVWWLDRRDRLHYDLFPDEVEVELVDNVL